jgi:hypothetical protein
MFYPFIDRKESNISEEKLTEVYEYFLKLFVKHSEILNYKTRIYNIIKYFKFDYKNIWCIDLSYVLSTVTPDDEEYTQIKKILDNISLHEKNYELFDIMNYEYILHFINIMDKIYPAEVIIKFKHLYSCVDIPDISTGKL